MGISAVGKRDTVGRASQSGAPVAVAAALSLSGDSLRLSRRDGGPEQAPVIPTPGGSKMAIGGTIAAISTVGLGLTLAATSAPFWVPLAFGAGVLVGGAILLKGAREFADHLASKMKLPGQ